MEAIAGPQDEADEFALIDKMSRLSGTEIPQAVEEIRTAPIRHNRECSVEAMKAEVKDILKN
jgi:threonine synthase